MPKTKSKVLKEDKKTFYKETKKAFKDKFWYNAALIVFLIIIFYGAVLGNFYNKGDFPSQMIEQRQEGLDIQLWLNSYINQKYMHPNDMVCVDMTIYNNKNQSVVLYGNASLNEQVTILNESNALHLVQLDPYDKIHIDKQLCVRVSDAGHTIHYITLEANITRTDNNSFVTRLPPNEWHFETYTQERFLDLNDRDRFWNLILIGLFPVVLISVKNLRDLYRGT